VFLYEFAEKTAQKPDTVATYVRRNKKIFKNHVERRQKQIWLDEKAVDILLKKYPEVQKKQKKPLNKEKFEEIITKSLKTLYENQEILAKEIDEIRALVEELEESFDHKQAEQQKEDNGLISLEKLFGEDTQVGELPLPCGTVVPMEEASDSRNNYSSLTRRFWLFVPIRAYSLMPLSL
jgi:hypothetical protein